MHSTLRGLLAALLVAAPLPLAAQNPNPQPGHPPAGHPMPRMGPGMMGHGTGGMGPGMGPGAMGMRGAMLQDEPIQHLLDMKNRLGLTDAQASRLQAIQSRFKSQNQDLLQKLQQEHQQMQERMQKQRQDLLGGKSPEDLTPEERQQLRQKMEQQGTALREEMQKQRDEMLPLVQKLRAARLSEMSDISGVLTPAQQDHLRLIMQEQMRNGRGMRGEAGWMRGGDGHGAGMRGPGPGMRGGDGHGAGMRGGRGSHGAGMDGRGAPRGPGAPPAPPTPNAPNGPGA